MDGHRRGGTGPVMLAGRYRLFEPLGHGGVAEVWRAEDVTLRRPVAVKLFGAVQAHEGAELAERLWREARATARLVHPNVVQVLDAGAGDDGLFLVTELVVGRDLAEVLQEQGPLEPVRVARLGAQVARALAAAHGAGLVHRDVKPANLLLTVDGMAKLADFGIAAPIYPAPVNPVVGGGAPRDDGPLVGSAAYVAPEQVLGHPASPASDLYALGCVLYELLTGHPPFSAATTRALLAEHLHQTPGPPTRARPDIPAELEQAVLRLLVKNPAERPADAAVVAGVLETIADAHAGPYRAAGAEPGTATQILPTLSPTENRRPADGPVPPWAPVSARQRPLLAAAVAAAALIAVVAVIVAVTEAGNDPATPRIGSPPAAAPPDDPTRSAKSTTPGRTAAVAPHRLLTALHQRIRQQARTGRLDPDTAGKIGDFIGHIAERLSKGKGKELGGKIDEIRGKLTEAADKGEWTPDLVTFRLLDQLRDAL